MIACIFVSSLNSLLFAILVKLTEEMIAVIHKKKIFWWEARQWDTMSVNLKVDIIR